MFDDWSPLQLADVLGLRIDLRHQGGGRVPYLVGPAVKERIITHASACRLLKRLARRKAVYPVPPLVYRRALIDGKEQIMPYYVKALPGLTVTG